MKILSVFQYEYILRRVQCSTDSQQSSLEFHPLLVTLHPDSLLDSQRYHVNLGLFSDQRSEIYLFLTDLRSFAAEKIKKIVRIEHYERLKRRYLYYY